MSPYGGSIQTPERKGKLVPRSYPLPRAGACLTVFPVRRDSVPDELVNFLRDTFNDVVREGKTYPQMSELSLDEFVRPSRSPSPTRPRSPAQPPRPASTS